MPGNTPPHSFDSEEGIAGSLLIDGSAIEKIADYIEPKHFYSERDRYVYEACLGLYQRSQPINQISVAEELNNRGRLEASGGAAYLSYLIANCPTSLDIENYAQIVHHHAMAREIIDVGGKIGEMGYDAEVNIDDAISRARTLLDAIKLAKSRYLELSNLRIIKSKPPHYILNVNGADLNITIGELQQWGRFRTKVLSELDFLPLKPKNWDGLINKLLEQSQKMEAPADTSAEVEVKLSVRRWFEQRGEGIEYSDIQSGCYAVVPYRGKETGFEPKDYWAFQPTPLLRWLKRDLGRTVTRDSLWAMAVSWGVVKHQWRIGKSEASLPAKLWALPPSFAESAEFAIEEKAEQPELVPEEIEEEMPDF